jgi:hypothetical protein
MKQTKLSKGPPKRLIYCDPRNFAFRRFQKNIKLPGETDYSIISCEMSIIEDYIFSMKYKKNELHKKHSVKPKETNFFIKRFLRL